MHRCQQAIALGLAPKILALILNQKYVGDVTIRVGRVAGSLGSRGGKK